MMRRRIYAFLLLVATFGLLAPVVLAQDQTCANDDRSKETLGRDYLIIGAGGSGIQLALLFEHYNLSYTILEKEPVVGSFWTKFPRFGEVISVNKWVRNPRERMRFDWHSFLHAPLLMYNVTQDYFPQGHDWHTYMAMVVELSNLEIEYEVEVDHVTNDGKPCVVTTAGVTRCANRRLFVGTGLREKEEPLLRAAGGIPYSQFTKEMAKHRRVCILGNGNSGFEVAENVYDVADRVTIYGKHRHRLSAVTRYTGDVRVKYLQVLENLNGKLLDTVDSFHDIPFPKSKGLEKVLNASQIDIVHSVAQSVAWLEQFNCESFVLTTGFRSHVPKGLTIAKDSPFPPTSDWYQSTENPSVHFIGWLMHEGDFRRGAGGFLSGYRYLIRNLVHYIRQEDEDIPYPFLVLTKEQVVSKVVERFQIADDLIILQDGVVLRDKIFPVKGNSSDNELYHYYEGISYKFHKDLMERNDGIDIFFSWGDGRTRTVGHVFDGIYRFNDTRRLINLFLHPIVEKGGKNRHIHEDLEMTWSLPPYVQSVQRVIRAALANDLSTFTKKDSTPFQHMIHDQKDYNEVDYYESAPLASGIDGRVLQALWKAVSTNHRPNEMKDFTNAMKKWQPKLFEHLQETE